GLKKRALLILRARRCLATDLPVLVDRFNRTLGERCLACAEKRCQCDHQCKQPPRNLCDRALVEVCHRPVLGSGDAPLGVARDRIALWLPMEVSRTTAPSSCQGQGRAGTLVPPPRHVSCGAVSKAAKQPLQSYDQAHCE